MHREKGDAMDTSVNMKMSPDEHRLIVSAVEEAAESARAVVNDREIRKTNPKAVQDARERDARLRDLRTKL